MNADEFRRVALGLNGAVESAHMGHPDFRANGKIFATIHHDHKWGMLKLTPEQQETFIRADPESFAPESGAWGRAGSTRVQFRTVSEDVLGQAMTLAWQNTAAQKKPAPTPRPASSGRSKPSRKIRK
jgi:hypothetical protein